MYQDDKTVSLKVESKTLTEIYDLAKSLNTSPAGVISMGLKMLRLAQGRIVEFKQRHSSVILETKTFADKPVRT